MNIEKALAIEGGINPIELEWLAEKASKCRRVVEIGSYKGRSGRVMADNMTEYSVLFCVDHFKGSAEHEGAYEHDDVLWKAFHANMKDHLKTGRVQVIACSSMEAATLFNGIDPLDMVFIDASHDYNSVVEDIRAWKPLLRSGGLLCGHDYGHTPIERAIVDIFGGRLPTVSGGSIWYTEVK